MKPAGTAELPEQPYSALISAQTGERVLLRFVNLGYQQHAVQILGIPLKVVGEDAQQLLGVHGEDLSRRRNTLYLAPGQTADAIITAPEPGVYPLYSTNFHRNTNAGSSFGGMITEVRISPRRARP
ncbi:MAG: hypothetical protein QME70_03880 [Bacillota bacterium]|nr:hypothetical protein [Bacillota bacterium]